MPGDLNLKKSWNPALMKNQKKVWEREQEALKEFQTIKQRQKEIAQEREKEEMIRLQYGSDPASMPKKDKLELNKLGWMYNDGPKDSEDDSGFREVEEDFLAKSDEVQQLLRGNKVVKTAAGSRFDKVASVGVQSAPKSLSDDPLLMIRKEHFKRRSDHRERSPDRHRSSGGPSGGSSRSRHGYSDREGSRSSHYSDRASHRERRDRDRSDRDGRDGNSYRDRENHYDRYRGQDRDSSHGSSSYSDQQRKRDGHRDDRNTNHDKYRASGNSRSSKEGPSRLYNDTASEKNHRPSLLDKY